MAAVAEIYNWEVTQGKQALDSSPVTADEFIKILETTQTLGMPSPPIMSQQAMSQSSTCCS
ncbi:hypothetical protein V8F06_004466 [Rhypophila decipiens]